MGLFVLARLNTVEATPSPSRRGLKLGYLVYGVAGLHRSNTVPVEKGTETPSCGKTSPSRWRSRRRCGNFVRSAAQFDVAAERIGKPQLAWRLAFRLQQIGTAYQYCHRLRTGSRDVEPIQAVEELHAARRVFRRRCRQRVDHHRRLLSLEFVDRSYPHSRQTARNGSNLGVVWGDDQNILLSEPPPIAAVIHPVNFRCQETLHERRDVVHFLD